MERDSKGRFFKGYKYTEEEKKTRSILYTGKNNPFYGKKHSKKTKKRLSKSHTGLIMKDKPCEHHIDLNRNNNEESNKLNLTNSKHQKLHRYAYHYLVETGKIDEYIKWFTKKYGLK